MSSSSKKTSFTKQLFGGGSVSGGSGNFNYFDFWFCNDDDDIDYYC